MGFFDFTASLDHYQTRNRRLAETRLNRRHGFLIEPFKEEIAGAKVLDLASHDGRWCYAFAGAGARSVLGIEARGALIDQFGVYPDEHLKARVKLVQNDVFEELEKLVRSGEVFDIIGVFGILYHLMDHHRLFLLLRRLKPRLIVVDSEFIAQKAPVVRLIREKTDNVLNAAPGFEGQRVALKGVPSLGAMEAIADTLGFDLDWSDWEGLASDRRAGVGDYFRKRDMRRATCVLRPRAEL